MVQSILVANPKGGSGKSTLATNLAGFYARSGKQVVMVDLDRQLSSLCWLSSRPAHMPTIQGWKMSVGDAINPPHGTQVVVLDSPAGLYGKRLTDLLHQVDRVLVPIQPSPFDTWATDDFLRQVMAEMASRKLRVFLGVIGMRVDPRTRSARELVQFLAGQDIPVIAWLRDAQVYVQAAANGLSLFDLPPSQSERDLVDWAPILQWLK